MTQPSTVTVQELARQVAQRTTLSDEQARAAVDALLSSVVTALRGGRAVTLHRLGLFKVKATPALTGVRAGEPTVRPASKKVLFRPAPALRAPR